MSSESTSTKGAEVADELANTESNDLSYSGTSSDSLSSSLQEYISNGGANNNGGKPYKENSSESEDFSSNYRVDNKLKSKNPYFDSETIYSSLFVEDLATVGADITWDTRRVNSRITPRETRYSKTTDDFTSELEVKRNAHGAKTLSVPGGFRRAFFNAKNWRTGCGGKNVISKGKYLRMWKLLKMSKSFDATCGVIEGSNVKEDENDIEKSSDQPSGRNTSTLKAFLLLLKSFVGTGVLFLPYAFHQGGLMFSVITLALFGLYTFWCYIILINIKKVIKGNSFEDLGLKLYGQPMKYVILLSLVLTQIGFAGAYVIFTAENLKAFMVNVFHLSKVHLVYFMVLQLLLFVPLSFTRDVSKLTLPSLSANIFILIGLIMVVIFSMKQLTVDLAGKPAEGIVHIFDKSHWSSFIGVAIFAFEGVGLIIPVQDSMVHPEKFPRVLSLVMLVTTLIMIFVAVLCYLAYGSNVQTIVLLNLPQSNICVSLVQLFYSMAIMLSTPLQMFPAFKIVEDCIFKQFKTIEVTNNDGIVTSKNVKNSGSTNWKLKWRKNLTRAAIVTIVIIMAYFGASNLNKFVSLVGSFACIPLVYMYPPLLRLRACSIPRANGKKISWSIVLDVLSICLGIVGMIYTSYQAIIS